MKIFKLSNDVCFDEACKLVVTLLDQGYTHVDLNGWIGDLEEMAINLTGAIRGM